MSAGWRSERRGSSDPVVQEMVSGYMEELLQYIPAFDPDQSAPPAPDDFEWPNGCFVLVFAAEVAIACGALRRLTPAIGELRRMWVRPAWRGQKVGRYLLAALENVAVEMHLTEVRLDTNSGLRPALGLYRSAGYRDLAPYNDNDFADVWMAKPM
jgi:GNAT superfamily N-acetyltransferase